MAFGGTQDIRRQSVAQSRQQSVAQHIRTMRLIPQCDSGAADPSTHRRHRFATVRRQSGAAVDAGCRRLLQRAEVHDSVPRRRLALLPLLALALAVDALASFPHRLLQSPGARIGPDGIDLYPNERTCADAVAGVEDDAAVVAAAVSAGRLGRGGPVHAGGGIDVAAPMQSTLACVSTMQRLDEARGAYANPDLLDRGKRRGFDQDWGLGSRGTVGRRRRGIRHLGRRGGAGRRWRAQGRGRKRERAEEGAGAARIPLGQPGHARGTGGPTVSRKMPSVDLLPTATEIVPPAAI